MFGNPTATTLAETHHYGWLDFNPRNQWEEADKDVKFGARLTFT